MSQLSCTYVTPTVSSLATSASSCVYAIERTTFTSLARGGGWRSVALAAAAAGGGCDGNGGMHLEGAACAAAAAAAADAPCGGARGENWRRVVHSSCHSRNPVPISHPTMWGSAHCTGNGPSSFDLWFCSCQLQSVSHTAALPGGVPGGQWIFRTSESTFDCDQKRASRYSSYPGLTRSDGICTMYCSPAGLVRSTRISRVPPLSRSSVVVMWSSHGPHSSRSSVLVAARLIFQCVATEPSPSIVYRHTNGSGRVVVPSGSFS
mmetsp:Transcript_26037/g.82507  ORF Transcript_26037/g.82507 Transcript_26037/m.82507 type:complete len:263 (+) Transcript_26037:58-846(+)|eukprot:scaffold17593_cov147-Isochrysis_galbana.AAC.1